MLALPIDIIYVMWNRDNTTFDAAGVPGWHYFLCDHAGSVRVIARLPDRASSLCSRGLNAVIPLDSVAQAEVSDRNLHGARLMIP